MVLMQWRVACRAGRQCLFLHTCIVYDQPPTRMNAGTCARHFNSAPATVVAAPQLIAAAAAGLLWQLPLLAGQLSLLCIKMVRSSGHGGPFIYRLM